ncbi:MAG: methyltransferase [Acidobacteria bacterium]|nr:methyltransferase [Acidobacteriota bacterium]
MALEFPLSSVGRADFDTLRGFLNESGYSEEFLLANFGAVSMHELLYARGARQEALEERYRGDGLALFLARLLLGGKPMGKEEITRYLPKEVERLMRETGLLNAEQRCPVLMHPAFGLLVASDRLGYGGNDFVMSGSEGLCRQFLQYIGRSPCDRFLDIGTGAGLAAMLASAFAREVWAVDIVDRAVRFTEWNCQLNGLENVRVVQGDLFAPVSGMQFDRIASNPPFEPSLTGDVVYSCGGKDGEAILERLIRDLPLHLAPGGRLYCLVEGTDREGETLDQRVVRWLGAEAARHDTALFVRDTYAPMHFAMQQVVHGNDSTAVLEQWAELYRGLKAQAVVIGHLMVQAHGGERQSFHRRARFHENAAVEDLEMCLDRETEIARSEAGDLRPVCGTGWELHVCHKPEGGGLRPSHYTFLTEYPLAGEWEVPEWLARMTPRCNGEIRAEQHAQWAKTNAGVDSDEVYRHMRALLWAGVLTLPLMEEPS